ncbi:glucose-1-phosphate adenylyltransferase [candidate division KSB1 bacterium]|nr:glucose-1-phosphate adenylyltransferase [candidate division KSB1 bacterium]
MKKTLAMILAGGRVDELSVFTLHRPKSAMPFGGLYRIIDFPLSNLMNSGIERVGILSQYRSDSLINHIGSGLAWDMMGSQRGITLLPPMKGTRSSDWYTGTADAVYQNLEFINRFDADYVLILSGDHIYNMDYQKLVQFHESQGAEITLAFVQATDSSLCRFGQGVIDNSSENGGRLSHYAEKPSEAVSNWISMTIYLFDRRVLNDVLENEMKRGCQHFGRDIFPFILDSYRISGYKFKNYWGYARTIQEYWQANMTLLTDTSPIKIDEWNIRTNLLNENLYERAPALIGNSALLINSLVYNGCLIEGSVENSILFPGVRVGAGSVVRDSILMYDTVIGPNAVVNRTIADVQVKIGENARIGHATEQDRLQDQGRAETDITIIGRNTRIPSYCVIGCGCVIYPNKIETDFSERIVPGGRTIQ